VNLPARASVALGVIALFLLVTDSPNPSSLFSAAGLVSGGVGWMLSKQGARGDYKWAVAGIILSGLAFVIYLAMVTDFLS
jgi:hypothetical protein